MRKILAAVMLLLLAAACAAGTAEETAAAPGLFDLYSAEGEDQVWLGTAVPLFDGVLITSSAVLPEDLSRLRISDGRNVWNAESAARDREGLGAVILVDTETQKPAAGVFRLEEEAVQPADCFVLTGDENRSRVYREVYSGTETVLRTYPCRILSLSGTAGPGSPLITGSGRLAGIAVGEWSEGTDRVIFLTTAGIYQSMSEALGMLTGAGRANSPEGLTVTAEGGTVTFDWSGMTLPEKAEDEAYYFVYRDSENRYQTYFRIEDGDTSCMIPLTPGRTYYSDIVASAQEPDWLTETATVTVLPPAERLTDYGFTSRVCAVAESAAEKLQPGNMPLPVEEVTEELLRSGRAYFYSATSYEVTEEINGLPLLVSLTDPTGNNYRYVSTWMYSPVYMHDDAWAVPLSETGLLDILNETGYPEGTYEVAMYIDGKLADSFTFDIRR